MRPARIVLLLIALIAGGLAAFLATRGSSPPPTIVVQQTAAPQPVAGTKVLVAKAPIGVGQRLDATVVDWQPWPADAVRPEYITSDKSPDADTAIVGTVARFEIAQGEPILDAKLAHTNQGIMSAVLEPGMRGVSIPVEAASGSGGFIIPNDRVDVVATDSSTGQTVSRVVLSNVKVLAIGTRLGQTGKTGAPADPTDPASQVFSTSIATLELAPAQADTLINAAAIGKISLVLRSVADFAKAASTTVNSDADQNQSVKLIRFGRAQSILAGAPSAAQPSITPTAYVSPPGQPAVSADDTVAAPQSGASETTVVTPQTTVTTTVTGPATVAPTVN